MANIMITYRCNLRCPYCFANEFVNKTYTDMTVADFKKALAFALSDGSTEIGLIGGEPTVHPDFSQCGKVHSLEHFRSRKEYLLNFYKDMDRIGVLAYYDCNKPPQCIWTDEEWAYIQWYKEKHRPFATNIDEPSVCHPVVDILPNLKAVRCFGMSEIKKVNIEDFDNIHDTRAYFENELDAKTFMISGNHACRNCYDRKTKQCMAGCIGFKYPEIQKMDCLLEESCCDFEQHKTEKAAVG